MNTVRGLIADDERLMREQLLNRLTKVWPELEVVGQARDGREAVELADSLRPDVVFLDIRMPLMTGIEAAAQIATLADLRCQVVFVTAYDEYAIDAFEQGALDYLLKPVEEARLSRTVQRLQARLTQTEKGSDEALAQRLRKIEQLLSRSPTTAPPRLRWLQATHGGHLRLIDVDDVLFFRSDDKYTTVQTRDAELLIRTSLRELIEQLDPTQFWQVHRSTVVKVKAIEKVIRDEAGHLRICVRHIPATLEVSRSYQHLFRQM